MNFLFPWAFLLAGLIPVLVALYLQRPRRRRLEVSTLLFWQRLQEREPHRKFLGQLRHPLSLLLQLLIFLLLLLALVRPQWGRAHPSGSTVVVLDARAHMQAGQSAVWTDAKNAAGGLVAEAGPGQEIALLSAEDAPQIVSPFSSDAKSLREKLAALSPSDGGGSLDQTVTLARELLASRFEPRRLVVITDRPLADAEGSEQILVGRALENVAILALAQRPVPASPQSAEIFVQVGNFSAASRETELEILLDNRILDLKKLLLAPGEIRGFSSLVPEEILRTGQGLLEARLHGADGLAVDDTARATLAVNQRVRVLLIGEDDVFLEQALKADPSLDVEILRPEAWKAAMGSGFDAVIFDNAVPERASLRDLGEGSFLFWGRSPFLAGPPSATAGFTLEKAISQSPLLWNVDFAGVRLRQAAPLKLPASGWRATTILENAGEPALVALESPEQRRLLVASFGVGDSNLPLKTGFPLLVSNMVHWLARNATPEQPLQAGKTFLPSAGERIATRPRGSTNGQTSSTSPVKLRTNGFYEIQGANPHFLAVNTADAQESDLRTSTQRGTAFHASANWIGLHFWQWLALTAFVLLIAEWLLHHRRITE